MESEIEGLYLRRELQLQTFCGYMFPDRLVAL